MKRKGRLSNISQLAIVAGVFLFLTPFYYFDRMDLARPSLCSAAAIGCAIATFWKHSTRRWFWVTIAGVIALHVYAILRIDWSEEWASVYVIGTIALLDYGVIAGLIKLVEIICRSPEEAESKRNRDLQ
ncbi:MAG: hypothetical protein ABSF70_05870 [Terracidiphilus sp.]|jgi:Ca2+/Na+ antiporter